MPDLIWRRSSRSGSYQNCVEVAVTLDAAYVRDSKDRAGGRLAVPARQWTAFLTSIKGNGGA